MSRLMDYFNEVDKNAAVRAAHQLDPTGSMSRFGLAENEQDAVISGDFKQLAGAVGIVSDEISQLQVIHVPQTIVN